MKKIYVFLLMILFLFCFTTQGFCETLTTYEYDNNTYTFEINDNLYSTLSNIPEFNDPDYQCFCFLRNMAMWVQFIPTDLNPAVYLTNIGSDLTPVAAGWVRFNFNNDYSNEIGVKYYQISETGYNIVEIVNGVYPGTKETYRDGLSVKMFSTMTVYTDNTFTDTIFNVVEPVVAPDFLNANTTTYGNTLENGKFNYFYINGNDLLNFSFSVTDSTLLNNNTIVFNLDNSSDFCYDKTLNRYAIPKSALSFQYLTGHTYIFNLDWFEGATPKNLNYTITTDFSLPTIINGVQNDLFSIDFEVQNISGVLLDGSINNNTLINNMPISSSYINPVTDGISGVFNAFYNAFTSTTGTTVRFYIPYSNGQYIDIPADLVSSHLPEPVIVLIQTIYWAFICIFIIKDISNIAELTKSGDILDSKTGNIKTDML